MLIKQFVNHDHKQFIYYFVEFNKNGLSRYVHGPNLFGPNEYSRLYCSNFELELIYD